jgi:hypothetical protein
MNAKEIYRQRKNGGSKGTYMASLFEILQHINSVGFGSRFDSASV